MGALIIWERPYGSSHMGAPVKECQRGLTLMVMGRGGSKLTIRVSVLSGGGRHSVYILCILFGVSRWDYVCNLRELV